MKLTRRQWIFLGLGDISPLAAAGAFLIEPGWVKLKRVKLNPANGIRLAHFTDLHYKGGEAFLRSLVDRINALKPDLVCFTGDLAEERDRGNAAAEILRAIRAPLFGVPGNHERWARADLRKLDECFASTGGAWLADRDFMALGGRVRIVGVGEHPERAEPRPGMTNIALMHYPAWADRLGPRRFDLILAGHSHGGQVRLPLVGALHVPYEVGRRDLGLYETPAGPLYVGAGVGWYSLKVRFFCRPEIAVIEF